jgi:protein-tyrosine phosphatase
MLRRVSFVVLTSILTGSMLARAEVKELVCIQTAPTEYRLSYSLTGDSHQVEIFASADPAGEKAIEPVLKTTETDVTIHAGAPGSGCTFF